MTIYPGYNLKFKYQKILSIEDKFMNERRMVRHFYPNNMGEEEQGIDPEMTHPVWQTYRSAKNEITKYCDENGVIEKNGEIKDRYLEVYCIRQMLLEHPDDMPESLRFAERMLNEGFLEPYVFISLFHIDIYPQFREYMSVEENREKSRNFIETYLLESY